MDDNKFHKHERIHNKKDYLSIYQHGIRSCSKNFTILASRNICGYSRIGITVSRKAGNAVRRNRIKRLLREFFRLHKKGIAGSQDIVIIAKKKIPKLSYMEVCGELESLVSQGK